MNPVEIEEAVSQISENSFNAVEFPFEFLLAFGRKSTDKTNSLVNPP